MGIRVWLQNMKSVLHDWPGSGKTPSGIYPYIGFRKKSEDMEHKLGACYSFIFLNCTPLVLRSKNKRRKAHVSIGLCLQVLLNYAGPMYLCRESTNLHFP